MGHATKPDPSTLVPVAARDAAHATPMAWHNFAHNHVRTAVAVAGVTFAVVLMFMQLGFLSAVGDGAVVVLEKLDFDIALRASDYYRLTDPRSFPKVRLSQAESVAGVVSAAPLDVAFLNWKNPREPNEDPLAGEQRAILTLAVRRGDHVFLHEATQRAVDQGLDAPKSALVDQKTRQEFGPVDGRRFGERDLGQIVELNGVGVRIAGFYECGAGLSAGGATIVERGTLQACAPYLAQDRVSLGLLKTRVDAAPHEATAIAARLNESLPADVRALTRDEFLAAERRHWVWETNYGLIFQAGVALAVIVGTAIVYQVLSSEVANLMPEYATLKAMGYRNQYIGEMLVRQSLMLAGAAFTIGLALAWILYQATEKLAGIPIPMTWFNAGLTLAMSAALCAGSAVAAVRRAMTADPADLF